MKYAVGQQVRIRPDLSSDMEVTFGVNQEMEELAGQVVTISDVRPSFSGADCYIVKGAGGWHWHEDMFFKVDMSVDEAFELVLKGGLTDEQYEKIRRERG